MYKYTSNDGLAHSNNLEIIKAWNDFEVEYQNKIKECCDYLKSKGIKAFHPDDGWVNREENYVEFSYPHFLLDIKVGDKIALGGYDKYRICEVTEIIAKKNFLAVDENAMFYKFKFKELKEEGKDNFRNKKRS